jgi:uncharacterized protein YdaU (DUF1376 family)
MSSADVWMPLYVADYLKDTGHLGHAEHGCYFLLLAQSWTMGPLPADEVSLSRLARCPLREWRKIAPIVLAFFVVQDGRLISPRLERERADAQSNAERRTDRASQAARARWSKQCSEYATSMPQALPHGCPSPSPSPSPEEEKELPKPSVSPSPKQSVRPKSPCGFEDFWAAYPRKVGKDAARRAWTSAMKRATVEEIAAGLNAAQWPTDRNFIPHPATWLNAGRWLDTPTDIAPEKPGKLDYLHGFLNGKDSLQ